MGCGELVSREFDGDEVGGVRVCRYCDASGCGEDDFVGASSKGGCCSEDGRARVGVAAAYDEDGAVVTFVAAGVSFGGVCERFFVDNVGVG